jgi:hypothetical protein
MITQWISQSPSLIVEYWLAISRRSKHAVNLLSLFFKHALTFIFMTPLGFTSQTLCIDPYKNSPRQLKRQNNEYDTVSNDKGYLLPLYRIGEGGLLSCQFDIFYVINWSPFTLYVHPFTMPDTTFTHTYDVNELNKFNVVNCYNFLCF